MNEYAITELAKMGLDMEPKGAGHHIRKFFERKNITPLQASKKICVSQEELLSLIDGGPLSNNICKKLETHYSLPSKLLLNLEDKYLAKSGV